MMRCGGTFCLALTRTVRPSNVPVVWYAGFLYQAKSWTKARRVVAKVEWHSGELFPRIGFIVTNLIRPPKRVVRFYNQRGTAEQWIKEGKNAVKWTRLSCHDFVDNQVRLQLFVLAYNLGNFLRQAVLPRAVRHWTLTTLREKLIKIGAKVVRHYSEDHLSDGGGGGSASVVPVHSGRDWAAAIGSRVVRMKADHGKNTSQQRRKCLHLRLNRLAGAGKSVPNMARLRKTGFGCAKRLAQASVGRIIAKMTGETQFAP